MSAAVDVKPSTNGTIKISRRGRVKFELDEADGPFEINVQETYDAWWLKDWDLRDKDGKLANEHHAEHRQMMQEFVQDVVNTAYAHAGIKNAAPQMTRAETDAFIVLLSAEVQKLRDFFSPKKDAPSSLPESTEQTRIVFQQ